MFVSGFVITHKFTDEAIEWFARARSILDELVVFVDEQRAAPRVHALAHQIADRVYSSDAATLYGSDFAHMIGTCRGEWVLRIDFDEELSPEWDDPRWRDLLGSGAYTHFWMPRRWVLPSGNYLACAPWSPDWQLRLFRNVPGSFAFPEKLHDTMRVDGAAGYFGSLALHHHELSLSSRARREEKARAYEQQRPGYGLGYFYLYEDYAAPEMPLPNASRIDADAEILRMPRLSESATTAVRLRAEPPPARLRVHELTWLTVELSNGSDHILCCGAPFPVNLAYHWLDRASGIVSVFDGLRTAILPELSPHSTGTWPTLVQAPRAPGEYLLQLTVVQEGVRWFEQVHPAIVQEFAVSVVD